ncbi:MAG: NADPH:quinone reductase [Luteimonas sp.]
MRAALYTRTGPAKDVLSIVDVERPEPGPGEVRVRVAWSGVNPSDVKSRAGVRSPTLPFSQIIPHSDGAGVIDAIGSEVAAERLGQRVWLWNAAWGRAYGTAAEWVVVPEQQAVLLPASVALEVGALLGIPALTAYHAVALGAGVSGRRVLIAGGAGSMGHYAIQMAKLAGAAQVLATVSSAAKAQLATAAGADVVLNYREGNLRDEVHAATAGLGVERIIEVDFAANAADDLAMLAPNGEIVAYGNGRPEISLPFFPAVLKNLTVNFFIVYHLRPEDRVKAISGLTQWLEAGTLQHNIAARLPLERIVEAHDLVESGRAAGNVVIDVHDPAPEPR